MRFAWLGYSSEQFWNTMSTSDQDAMLDDCFTYDRKLLKEGALSQKATAAMGRRWTIRG